MEAATGHHIFTSMMELTDRVKLSEIRALLRSERIKYLISNKKFYLASNLLKCLPATSACGSCISIKIGGFGWIFEMS